MRTIMDEVSKLGQDNIGLKKDYFVKTEEGLFVKYEEVNYQFPNGIDAFSIFGKQIIRDGKVIYDWNENPVGFLTQINFYPGMFCNGDNARSLSECGDENAQIWNDHRMEPLGNGQNWWRHNGPVWIQFGVAIPPN